MLCTSRIAFVSVIVLLVSTVRAVHYIRAPCVFRGDDVEMHKYSAVLAATEPFKEACQRHVLQSVSPLRRLSLWIGGSVLRRAASIRDEVEDVDTALSRYETRVGQALRAYGLELEEFNEISKLASSDASLRRKINLQSFYYKIAADLQANLNNGLSELPKLHRPSILESISSALRASLMGSGNSAAIEAAEVQMMTPLQRFARSVASIEAERIAMRETLKEELKLKDLPARMSDPALQSAFCPKIRRLSAAFPRVAQDIVTRNGFDAEQFEDLQRKLQRNIFFRTQVQREIHNLEKQ